VKLLVFLITIFLLIPPSMAGDTFKLRTVKTWTTDSAREEAFRNVRYQVDLTPIKSTMTQVSSRQGLKGYVLNLYPNGSYALFDKKTATGFVYDKNNTLIQVLYAEQKDTYPKKGFYYGYPDGKLAAVSISVSLKEQFSFNSSKGLENHWVSDKCYKADGSPCGTRRLIDFN
jgi:hypothetical protein